MKKFLLIFVLFIGSVNATSVSIIVPCYYKHFDLLEELCDNLCSQTEMPDEVVISLSEAHRVDPSKIYSFLLNHYPFDVRLCCTNQMLYAGQNRNEACKQAKGDIFICQDADDLPHPQRVEMIKMAFENKKIDLLLHRWVPTSKGEIVNQHYCFENIPFYNIRKWEENEVFDYIHYGNSSIRRQVFDRVKWTDMKNSEDKRFLEDSMKKGFSLGMMDAFLLIYRMEYSSGN